MSEKPQARGGICFDSPCTSRLWKIWARLESSPVRKCSVALSAQSGLADRCFAAAGPLICYNLPVSLWEKRLSWTEISRKPKTFNVPI